MKLTSPAFADNLPVPIQYTANGENASPPFEFIHVPRDTSSFTLIVEDLDSPDERIHWLVYNIPGDVTHFSEGKIPADAIEGICNDGKQGYKGPCPKNYTGIHRFCYKLFALDSILEVPPTADAKIIKRAMEGHILEAAELTGFVEGEGAP